MRIRFVPATIFLMLNTPTVFAQTKTYALPEEWQNMLQLYPSRTAKNEAIEVQELRNELRKEGFLLNVNIEAQQRYGSTQAIPGSFFPLSSRLEASVNGQLQNYMRITSLFTGVITGRFVSEGALVGESGAQSEPLFKLMQENRLRLVEAIPPKPAQALTAETKATFTLIEHPDQPFTATLSRYSGALDARTTSPVAEFDIHNAGAGLGSGQYVKVSVDLQRQQRGAVAGRRICGEERGKRNETDSGTNWRDKRYLVGSI